MRSPWIVALLTLVGILVWALNPFAAALLVPALHFVLLAVAPEISWSRAAKLGLLVLGLVPAGIVALLAFPLPFKLGLFCGAIAGIAAATLADSWQRRGKETTA